jgi:hypothetical protein
MVRDFDGSENWDFSVLGDNTMQSDRWAPTFRRNLLLSFQIASNGMVSRLELEDDPRGIISKFLWRQSPSGQLSKST